VATREVLMTTTAVDRDGLVLFLEGACPDMDKDFLPLYRRSVECTAASAERLYAVYLAMRYIVAAGVEGDIVECGVWRGGNCMLAALTLMALGDESRSVWLYDTFSGMTDPTERDRDVYGGAAGDMRGQTFSAEGRPTPFQFVASRDEFAANMAATGFPAHRAHYVEGPVEETLPAQRPRRIALLRLDTDWYASTSHSMRHLYPLLSQGGVLLLDDYGDWPAVREAVHECLDDLGEMLLLNRIDNTGRIAIRTATPAGTRTPE
jgi:O-methyltransferase